MPKYILPILIFFFMLIINSCKTNYYFPMSENENYAENKLDIFKNKWYSKNLTALKEPILKDLKLENKEIYRYTNIGTWSAPYSYRIEKSDSEIIIIKKRSNGQGGYDPGLLVEDETKYITEEDFNELIDNLNKIYFWSLPTHDDQIGLDGAEWIIEGYKNGTYHFVTRWTPDYDGVNDFVRASQSFEQIFLNN